MLRTLNKNSRLILTLATLQLIYSDCNFRKDTEHQHAMSSANLSSKNFSEIAEKFERKRSAKKFNERSEAENAARFAATRSVAAAKFERKRRRTEAEDQLTPASLPDSQGSASEEVEASVDGANDELQLHLHLRAEKVGKLGACEAAFSFRKVKSVTSH